jgi:hypothetical protein
MPRKMARQTLERHAGACYAGSRPYLGSGLLGSPENRYNLPKFPSSSGESRLNAAYFWFARCTTLWAADRGRSGEALRQATQE